MVKVIRMQDLDCAHCAEKMEKKIGKIEGVHSVSISFMAQKMILDCDSENFDRIFAEIQKAVSAVDKNCSVKA